MYDTLKMKGDNVIYDDKNGKMANANTCTSEMNRSSLIDDRPTIRQWLIKTKILISS